MERTSKGQHRHSTENQHQGLSPGICMKTIGRHLEIINVENYIRGGRNMCVALLLLLLLLSSSSSSLSLFKDGEGRWMDTTITNSIDSLVHSTICFGFRKTTDESIYDFLANTRQCSKFPKKLKIQISSPWSAFHSFPKRNQKTKT